MSFILPADPATNSRERSGVPTTSIGQFSRGNSSESVERFVNQHVEHNSYLFGTQYRTG